MNEDISRNSNGEGIGSRNPRAKLLLALMLGALTFSHYAVLRAQEPTQGATPSPSASAQTATPVSSAPSAISDLYLITPNDVLDINIYDVPELSHSYTVNPAGVISMPLLPTPVKAAGLTTDEFARALEEAYRQSGRLRRPEIAISVKQSPNSSVAVEGAVRTPQLLLEIGRVRLVDLITQCGGLTDDAGGSVTITRSLLALRNLAAGGGQATPTLTLELKRVMDVTDPDSQTAVWPGDRVTVQRTLPDVYYVLGEVKSPGSFTLRKGREDLTVLRAVALAGDLTGVAKKSKAIIIRKDPKAPQGRDEIKLDLQNILKGKTHDPVLQADDILFVPGSSGKKALRALQGVPGQALGSAGAAALIIH